MKIVEKEKLPLRQSYRCTLKKLSIQQRFRNHPKNKSKAKKADKKVRIIAGRLVRELERNLAGAENYKEPLTIFKKVLQQTRTGKNKIYSLHESDTQCISKGKEHKKYEFGNKGAFISTQNTNVIIGALGGRNEYDGHLLEPALEQVNRMIGKAPEIAFGDRGCKGKKTIGNTIIKTPSPFNKRLTNYQKKKLKKGFTKRAAIEPIIGLLKTDHRLGRNFYKGIIGDNINIMLAAAAFNFKRMMNKWKNSHSHFYENLFQIFLQQNIQKVTF